MASGESAVAPVSPPRWGMLANLQALRNKGKHTRRTKCKVPAVAIGRMKKGSGIARFENHNMPPPSKPGTGKWAIARKSTNVP